MTLDFIVGFFAGMGITAGIMTAIDWYFDIQDEKEEREYQAKKQHESSPVDWEGVHDRVIEQGRAAQQYFRSK